MINITSYVIDDLNNGFKENETLDEKIQVYKNENKFYVFYGNESLFITESINFLIEILFTNYKVVK